MDWLKNEVRGMSCTSFKHWKAESAKHRAINAPCLAKPLERVWEFPLLSSCQSDGLARTTFATALGLVVKGD